MIRDDNVCDHLLAPKWLQMLYAPKKGVEMVHKWTGPVTRDDYVWSAQSIVRALYKNSPLLLLFGK